MDTLKYHNYVSMTIHVHVTLNISSGVETASHAGHCPINLVNVR